ncbi:MAG: YlbF family regulator [Lachnospiraceae bacterium]|nr:YlbF family regulator [Lachnospiraceae bacterium]
MIEHDVLLTLDALVDALRNSAMYRRYRDSSKVLTSKPDLFRQVMELRKQTIDMYHDPGAGDLAESTDRLAAQFEEVTSVPEVYEFLEAEEAMIQMLKTIDRRVYGCVGLHLPGE